MNFKVSFNRDTYQYCFTSDELRPTAIRADKMKFTVLFSYKKKQSDALITAKGAKVQRFERYKYFF